MDTRAMSHSGTQTRNPHSAGHSAVPLPALYNTAQLLYNIIRWAAQHIDFIKMKCVCFLLRTAQAHETEECV